MERRYGKPGPRVLVAEDDEACRTAAYFVLDRAGMRVTLARDGREAISILETAAVEGIVYDLLILDIRMPGASGWEVLRRSRELAAPGAWPPRVLLVTGFSAELDLDRVKREGASGILIKPVPTAALLYEAGRVLSIPPQVLAIHGPGPADR